MKRTATTLLALLLAASSAHAALRIPQVAVSGPSLQGYLNGVGETINVLTDQENVQRWGSTVSTNATFTVQLELSATAAANTVGLYNASAGIPALYQVFPGAATANWFATASFRTAPARVIVTLFDDNAIIQGQTTYLGADANDFGFYIQGPNGTFYTQDARNPGGPGGTAQALAFKATGGNSGNWWLAFEDAGPANSDRDFDDCVLFMESVNPTPVKSTTWGSLKQRFR
ncbi:MAG: hypothetical protein ABL977_11775 [Candidatus Eisenbacteria bacterium]